MRACSRKKQDLEKITSYEEGECYFVYADQNGLSPILSATMQFEVEGWPREATVLSVGHGLVMSQI